MTPEVTAQADIGQSSGRRTGGDGSSDVRGGVREYLTHSKEKLVEMEKGLEGYVQEHPIRSILIAAGVGVVVGALVARR